MNTRTLATCWIAVTVTLLAGGLAATAMAAPKQPKSIQAIDRQLDKAAKQLGKRQTVRLRSPIHAAGRAIRGGRRCAAARALTTVVTRAGRLRGARERAAAPVATRARGLSRRLVASQRRHGACGLRIAVRVKPGLRPAIAALPPIAGAAKRPVFRIQGSHATTDFAERELLFSTSGKKGLAGLLRRTGGRLISSSSSPHPKTKYSTIHLIALPKRAVHVSASRRKALVADLRQADPLARGALAASSAAGLAALAIVAHERARGLHVGLNPVMKPDQSAIAQAIPGQRFLDGQSLEDPAVSPAVNNSRNAFDWPWFTDAGPNAYGVADAWRDLEVAGKLTPGSVRIAIIDGGFVSAVDLPSATTGAGTAPKSGSGPTHGYYVAQAAAGLPDNAIGAAGPAGPIADLRLINYSYDGASQADRIYDAIRTGARIINMSYGANYDALFSGGSNAADDAIEEAVANNILPIAAAGNDGEDVDAETCYLACWESVHHSPCEADGVLCVGGVDGTRINRHPSSNYGREWCDSDDCDVKLFAPFSLAVYGAKADGTLTKLPQIASGTSFAAPFVAGVAALALAAQPTLSQSALRSTLFETANPSADDTVPRVVNAQAAVRSVLSHPPPVVGIVRPPRSAPYTGNPEPFEGTAVSAGPATCCTYRWSTMASGLLGTGAVISARLAAGTTLVTLEATDSDGAKGSTTVPIDRPPTIASDTSLTANCSSGVRPGDTATIQGMLTNAPAGSPVTIELTDPHGTTQTIPVTTTASGIYITSLNPSILGTWRVFTRFAGSPSRNASSAVCAFVVAPAGPGPDPTATSLLCPAAPAQYRQFGIAVPLNGNITPSPVSSSNTMVLEFLKPDGTLMHANAVIAASGDFQYAFDSNAALGEWRVTAMFDGTSAFASSQSQPCEFQIVPGPK